MLKTVVLLHIFVETMMNLFQDSSMNKKGFILEEKLHLASLSFVHAVMTQTVCPKLWGKTIFYRVF